MQIKDSGKREEYASGMKRDTQEGKPNFNLLLIKGFSFLEQPLTDLAIHLTNGAKKYDLRNWEKANSEEELERFKTSALRHLIQFIIEESDEDHASAAMFNIMAAKMVQKKLIKEKKLNDNQAEEKLSYQQLLEDLIDKGATHDRRFHSEGIGKNSL